MELEGTLRSEAGETEGQRKGGDWKGIELRRRIVWPASEREVSLMLLANVLGDIGVVGAGAHRKGGVEIRGFNRRKQTWSRQSCNWVSRSAILRSR